MRCRRIRTRFNEVSSRRPHTIIVTVAALIFVTWTPPGSVVAAASHLAKDLATIFNTNSWSAMTRWLPEEQRVYIRLPNIQSGFLTPNQARKVFSQMQARLVTGTFKITADEGTPEERWLVRAKWTARDKATDDDYTFTLEVGWEYRHEAWQLLLLQAQ